MFIPQELLFIDFKDILSIEFLTNRDKNIIFSISIFYRLLQLNCNWKENITYKINFE